MYFRNHKKKKRRGVCVAEAAFCIPVILILAFGTLETCKLIFLKEKLSICAFEGCRIGVKRHAVRTDVEQVCNQLMQDFGIQNYTLTVTPSDFTTLRQLDPITVQITVPLNGSQYLMGFVINQQNLSSTVRMAREFND